MVFGENGELKGPVAKNLSDEERNGLREAVGAEEGDAVFFAAGSRESSQLLLGAVRVELASREGLLDPKKFAFTWVVDFPLFKPTDDPDDDDVAVGHSKWTSMHHPFTFPKAGGGRDPLTGAPAPISDEQRAETGVDYDPDADEN